jgi:hypothetical protein
MQTKNDRLAHLNRLLECDMSIIHARLVVMKQLAAIPESAWTKEHEAALKQLEVIFSRS